MQLEHGQQAPPFTARDEDGNEVSLSDFAGAHLVMYFYPAAFTPGCTTESCDFRDRYEAFESAGYRILGVSPDQPGKLKDFRAEYDLPFHLLSDPDHAVADAYGAWGIKKNYGKEYEGIIRSTISIDPDGMVISAWYNVKAAGHAERVANAVLENA
jgi:thioredoxin-dependent peroxiredoxin